jgi:hypothetical protein
VLRGQFSEAALRHYHVPIMNWYSNPEVWLCILGFPTLIFVGCQTWTTAKAAKAALLNAQAVITAERAWVMADLSWYGESLRIVEETGTFGGGPTVETTEIENIKLTCKNQGKSPAWIDVVHGQIDIVDSTSVCIDPIMRNGNHGPMGPLGAGEEQSRSLELRCKGRIKPHEFLSVYVVIEYRDIFEKTHETHIGYSVSEISLGRQNGLPERNRNT